MKFKKRLGVIAFCFLFFLARVRAQTDWPIFGHDPGGMRFSPLKQINTTNVEQLRLAWQFDTAEADAPPATAPIIIHANPAPEPGRRSTPRLAESIPLVVGGVLYTSTGYNRVVGLDADRGHKIWESESQHAPALRGVSYWPGARGYAPAIVFGTLDVWLI